jgi:hypothetical protein
LDRSDILRLTPRGSVYSPSGCSAPGKITPTGCSVVIILRGCGPLELTHSRVNIEIGGADGRKKKKCRLEGNAKGAARHAAQRE